MVYEIPNILTLGAVPTLCEPISLSSDEPHANSCVPSYRDPKLVNLSNNRVAKTKHNNKKCGPCSGNANQQSTDQKIKHARKIKQTKIHKPTPSTSHTIVSYDSNQMNRNLKAIKKLNLHPNRINQTLISGQSNNLKSNFSKNQNQVKNNDDIKKNNVEQDIDTNLIQFELGHMHNYTQSAVNHVKTGTSSDTIQPTQESNPDTATCSISHQYSNNQTSFPLINVKHSSNRLEHQTSQLNQIESSADNRKKTKPLHFHRLVPNRHSRVLVQLRETREQLATMLRLMTIELSERRRNMISASLNQSLRLPTVAVANRQENTENELTMEPSIRWSNLEENNQINSIQNLVHRHRSQPNTPNEDMNFICRRANPQNSINAERDTEYCFNWTHQTSQPLISTTRLLGRLRLGSLAQSNHHTPETEELTNHRMTDSPLIVVPHSPNITYWSSDED